MGNLTNTDADADFDVDADTDADTDIDADIDADADTDVADDELEAQQAGPEMDTRICRDRPAAGTHRGSLFSAKSTPTQPNQAPPQYFADAAALRPFSSTSLPLTSSGWWLWRCP